MYLLFAILIALISVLLVLIVMVQNPKGGGLNSSFGGTGGGTQLFGVQRTNDFLDKSTWVLAIAMMALILLSNFAIERNTVDSTLDNRIEQQSLPSTPESTPKAHASAAAKATPPPAGHPKK